MNNSHISDRSRCETVYNNKRARYRKDKQATAEEQSRLVQEAHLSGSAARHNTAKPERRSK